MSVLSPRLTPAQITALGNISPSQIAAIQALVAGGAASTPVATTSPSTAYGGPNALVVSSAGAGGATTPHQDAFLSSVLALLDVRVKVSARVLSGGGGLGEVVGTWGPAATGYAGWMAIITPEGYQGFVISDSSTGANIMILTTVPPSSPNTDIWLRWVYVISGNGANQVTMYSSMDGVNYTRLGLVYGAVGARILMNASPLSIGGGAGNVLPPSTNIRAVQIYTEAGKVVDADFTNVTTGAGAVTASTGQVFTINAPGAIAASTSVDASGTSVATPVATPTSNVSITYNGPMVTTPVPAITTLLGTYCPNNTQEIADYATWLGAAPGLASIHTGQGSRADLTGSVDYCIGSNGYGGNRCISVPLTYDTHNGPAANAAVMAQAAAGQFNSDYTTQAQKILAKLGNQSPIYIRFPWEENLYQLMPWASNGHEADYIAMCRNGVTAFRAVDTNNQFKFIFGPNIGGDDPMLSYWGDAYCDGIGLDVYINAVYGDPSDPYLCFDYMRTRPFGLDWLTSFAAAHGKFTCIPEFGVNIDFFGAYFKLFFAWAVANNVRYMNTWDSNGDYPSKLSQGSQLLANGAAYRHYVNPTKYPQEPLVRWSLMRNAQDVSQGPWFQGYMANGTATRTANTIAFDGVGNSSQNQQIVWVLNNAPAGNYVFTTTGTRTAGTDTTSIWIGDGTPSIAGVDLTTAKAPLNQPTRISVPFTLAQRMSNLKIVIYHGQPGTVTIKLTDFGLWEDMTADPFPQAGIVAPTPPTSLVTFTGASGAPTGNQALSLYIGTGGAVCSLDGTGAVVFDGSNSFGVLTGLGARGDGLYTISVKPGTTPSCIRIPFRIAATGANASGYILEIDYANNGRVATLVHTAGAFVKSVTMTGSSAPVPQRSIGLRMNGSVFTCYIDDVPVGSCGDATYAAAGLIGLGGASIGFTAVGFSA